MTYSYEQISQKVPGISKEQYMAYIHARSLVGGQNILPNRDPNPELLTTITMLESLYTTLRPIFDAEIEHLSHAVEAARKGNQ